MILPHQADIQDVEAPVTIEVTPEMIKAGQRALDGLFLGELTGWDLQDDWLASIFLEMFRAGGVEAKRDK